MSAPTGSGCSHGPRTSSRASRDHIPSRLPGRGYRKNLVDMISAGYLNTLLEDVAG